jgi:uncharacterized phage protein (TIGR01671 family)
MREILFKGKSIKTGEWVEGYYGQFHNRPILDRPNTHQIFEPMEDAGRLGSMIGGIWHIVDPETVGQFIGLLDKNGKKIFEGDIIHWYDHVSDCVHTALIGYDAPEFVYTASYEYQSGWMGSSICDLFYAIGLEGYIEVIGNIHDNPELMEVCDEESKREIY